jgi:hypothetical protein
MNNIMADNNNPRAGNLPKTPNPALKKLDRLVGGEVLLISTGERSVKMEIQSPLVVVGSGRKNGGL